MLKYRIAKFKNKHDGYYIATAYSDNQEYNFKNFPEFVSWETNWIIVE